TVTFPSEYPNSELAGKEAVFKVVVREIKEKVLPEINDEFARDVGDFADLAELKARIRENLAAERAHLAELEVAEQLVAAVTAGAEVEVPEVLVERRLERKVRDLAVELAHRGRSLEDFLGPGRTEEDLKAELRPAAVEEVKRALVLEAIAKAEGIEATPEEVDRRIAKLMGLDEGDKAALGEMRQRLIREGRLESVLNQIRIDKVLEFLAQSAEIAEERAAEANGAARAAEAAGAERRGEGEV
ncbi:MAG: trigger factor, partial [Bacillota bacterium]|nr:trigger factor [Bacillota bacterium]